MFIGISGIKAANVKNSASAQNHVWNTYKLLGCVIWLFIIKIFVDIGIITFLFYELSPQAYKI